MREKILLACGDFLVPIARFLLRSGIGYREFSEIAKNAFVRVASEDYGLRGRMTNISRVAVMTGLTRKEVRKRREHLNKVEPRVPMNPAAMVLQGWFTDPEFLNHSGQPLELNVEGTPSFTSLMRKYAGDIPVGAMRTELRRAGAIEESGNGTLRAMKRYFIPVDYDDRLITSISMMLTALADTIAHNANRDRTSAGRIQRFVYSDRLRPEAIPKFRSMSRESAAKFIEMIDDWIASNEMTEPPARERRVGVGVFYFEEDSD